MKLLLATMGTVVACLVSVSRGGAAEPDKTDSAWGDLLRWVSTNAPAFQGTNLFKMPTNLVVPFFAGTNRGAGLSPGKALSPGVYLSKPYSCLVVVPELHADAGMVVKPGSGIDSKMPMIEPKVEFVPFYNR